MNRDITRRTFGTMLPAAALAVNGAAALAWPGTKTPTAAEVIARLHAELEAEGIAVLPQGKTADKFVAGNPDLPVRGIATTFMCTFDVMRRAREAGLSLIISHEPTFWHHQDSIDGLPGDPTYETKKRYAEENGLTVWRFHDHWHMRKPDPIVAAFNRKLGFETNGRTDEVMALPPTRLADLVERIAQALDTPNIRFWGDPDRIVRRMRWGGHLLRQIAGQDSEVFLWLEPKEFNTFEYFRDAGELGIDRCIIGATHELVEEWGMLEPCADWVRALVPEVPVTPLRTAELYWTV